MTENKKFTLRLDTDRLIIARKTKTKTLIQKERINKKRKMSFKLASRVTQEKASKGLLCRNLKRYIFQEL